MPKKKAKGEPKPFRRTALPKEEWWSKGQVCRSFGISSSTLMRWIQEGMFDEKDLYRMPMGLRAWRIRKAAVLYLLQTAVEEVDEQEEESEE